MQDLITLAQAGNYLNLDEAQYTSDVELPTMISAASQMFLTLTSLPYIALTTFTERRNGTGTSSMTTKNRPLQSITSLVVNNVNIPASADGIQPGYYFNVGESVIYLTGGYSFYGRFFSEIGFGGYPGKFAKGFGNVFVNGTAGYPNSSASVTAAIPAPIAPAVVSYYSNPLFATLVVSAGAVVMNLNTNLPLTEIPSGTPASGQFVLNPGAVFVFAGADAGIPVKIDYTAIGIPFDVQQCVFEMVGWAYKERDRIGMTSQRFADNLTNSFAKTPFSERAKLTINRYSRKDAVGFSA